LREYSWGCCEKGTLSTVKWSVPAIFSNFGRHIFGIFKLEDSNIMQRQEVPYRLASDRKMFDLE